MKIGRQTNLPLTYVNIIYEGVAERPISEVLEDESLLPAMRYLCAFMQFPNIDLIPLFSFLIKKSLEEESVSMKQVLEFFGKKITYYHDLEDSLHQLIQMKILNSRFDRYAAMEENDHKTKLYRIRKTVQNAIVKGDIKLLTPEPVKNIIQFLVEVAKQTRRRERDCIDTNTLFEELEFMYDASSHIEAVSSIIRYEMGKEEELLFWNISHRCINRNQETVDIGDVLNDIYDNPVDAYTMKRKLIDKELLLVKNNLIKLNKEVFSFFLDVKLTEEATQLLIEKISLKKNSFKPKICKLEEYQDLPQERLFYNQSEAVQIDELIHIVQEDAFKGFLKKTKEHNLSGGLTILLHGYAGTGKTATAKKIAKETRRHLLWVEVDKIKSCFVGESEQNLQALFDEYEEACKLFDKQPVLLFNEADAILAKRMNVTSSADQMNNSLQNILLQRMESFSGIFIATTNLASHLDKAFDRRFLYKIQFMKPDLEVRKQIIQNAFPEQSSSVLEKINQYALTGGQIMNIKKRLMVQNLLNREATPLEKLCEEELSLQPNTSSIGFVLPKNT